MQKQEKGRTQKLVHVSLILLAAIAARVPFYLAYRPVWSGDSPGYSSFYFLWLHHLFFLGERTPLYPFFLGLAQWLAGVEPQPYLVLRANQTVVILQSVLGVLSGVLLYFVLRALRMGGRIAFGAALLFVSIPAICLYEMNILNMSLSCVLMVLAAALFLATMRRLGYGESAGGWALGTGIALSLSVMNRPDLLIFAILLVAMMAAAILRGAARKAGLCSISAGWKSPVLLALPVACAVLGWMTLVYLGIGQFRITTLDGWNRSRTVYNLFDRVDPEDATIGGIMARNYRQMVAQHAGINLREVMWQAQREIFDNYPLYPIVDTATDPGFLDRPLIQKGRNATGLRQVSCKVEPGIYCWESMRRKIDTGDYLGRVSGKLARRYPAAWLHNVAANFVEESFNFRYADAKSAVQGVDADAGDGKSVVRNPALATATAWAIDAEAPLLTLFYLVTLGFFFYAPVAFFRKPDEFWWRDMAVGALAGASVGTIVGTCILAGFNRVYTLPHLVVFVVVAAYVWEQRSRIVAAVRRGRK